MQESSKEVFVKAYLPITMQRQQGLTLQINIKVNE